jgi:hypothetical protein
MGKPRKYIIIITEHEDITVLWNQGTQTDREVLQTGLI